MAIAKNEKKQKLFKILIGAAWIDGIMQPEERTYLRRIATELNLIEDPEIKPLLSELKTVEPTECYLWLEEYLEENPTLEDYQELLEKISGLIYSDGDVDIRETQLIEKLQHFDPAIHPHKTIPEKVLFTIQKLYQKAVQEKEYSRSK